MVRQIWWATIFKASAGFVGRADSKLVALLQVLHIFALRLSRGLLVRPIEKGKNQQGLQWMHVLDSDWKYNERWIFNKAIGTGEQVSINIIRASRILNYLTFKTLMVPWAHLSRDIYGVCTFNSLNLSHSGWGYTVQLYVWSQRCEGFLEISLCWCLCWYWY